MATAARGRGAARALGLLVGVCVPVGILLYVGGQLYITSRQTSLVAARFRVLSGFAGQLADTVEGTREALKYSTSCENVPSLVCDRQSPDASSAKPVVDGDPVLVPRSDGDLAFCTSADQHTNGKDNKHEASCGRLGLGKLVANLPRQDFEAFLLVTTNGQVLHREGLPTAVANVGDLPPSQDSCAKPPPPDGVPPPRSEPPAAGPSPKESPPEHATSWRLSPWWAERVCMSGEPFLLFCEPLPDLRLAGTDELGLCGLVEGSRFETEARQIAWVFALPLFLVFVLALLSLPVVTLWSLSPRERLRALDVKVLVLAVLLAAGILTLVVGSLSFRAMLRDEADRRLKTVAQQVRAGFDEEVSHTSQVIDWVRDAESVAGRTPPEGILEALRLADTGAVRHFWTAPPGSAFEVVDPVPEGLNLKDRGYFQAALNGRAWRAGTDDSLDTVYSRLDGRLLLVAARKVSPVPADKDTDTSQIAAVSTTMPHFTSQLDRPLGKFERFAVVDRDGSVKLHSQVVRSLRENLTLESDRAPELTAALWHRAGGLFDVLYHGRDHRMRVDPIAGSDWSIVSFLDMQEIRAAVAEQFEGAAGLFFLFATLFVLAALLIHVLDPHYRAEWLWPDRRPWNVDGYLGAAGCLLVTAAVVPHILADATIWRAVQLACLPLATVGLLRLALRHRGDVDEKSLEVWVATAAAVIGSVGLLSGCAIAPARHVFGCLCLLATAVLWASRIMTAAPWSRPGPGVPSVPGRFRGATAALTAVVAVVLSAMALSLGHQDVALIACATLPIWVFGETGRARLASSEIGFRFSYVTMLLGLVLATVVAPARVFVSDASTQVSREVQQLDKQSRHESEGAPGQPEGHAAWTGTMTARLLEYLPLSSHLAAELRTMSVGPSEQAADLDPGNSWASGLLLAAGFAFLWLLVQRVFLLDIDQLGDPSRRDLQHPPGTLKIWVYDHTGEGVEQRVSERVTVDRLDGRRDYTEVDLEEWAREHAAGDGLVEISHLDACLDNTKRTARLLDVVESLAAQRHKALLITSPLDPVEQLAGRLAEEGDQPEQTDPLALLHQRWIDVLGGFSTPSHDIPARENEDGFDRVLEQEYPDIRITSRGESREELETCHRKIWAQCTVPQRLILRQLAEEGFVNPAAAFVVRGLMKRGLIRRDDALKLASPQFREFARHADPEEIVARWEREEGASDWSRLRTPLAATLLIGLGLFLYTQPELSKSALGAATALAAVLPLAMRLFGNAKEEGK